MPVLGNCTDYLKMPVHRTLKPVAEQYALYHCASLYRKPPGDPESITPRTIWASASGPEATCRPLPSLEYRDDPINEPSKPRWFILLDYG